MSVGCEGGQIDYKLTVDTTQVLRDIHMLNAFFNRTISVMRRMGLSENIDDAITKIQRAIAIANTFRLAMIALHTASGPAGWAFAGIGALTFLMDAGTFIDTEMRGQ